MRKSTKRPPDIGDILDLALLQLHERVLDREWPAVKLAVALLPNLVERRPSLPIATTNILSVSDALRASGEVTTALMQGQITEKAAKSVQAAIKNFADLASAQRLENLERMISKFEKESRADVKGGAFLTGKSAALIPVWMKAPGETIDAVPAGGDNDAANDVLG
jgi:hypothetical protein